MRGRPRWGGVGLGPTARGESKGHSIRAGLVGPFLPCPIQHRRWVVPPFASPPQHMRHLQRSTLERKKGPRL